MVDQRSRLVRSLFLRMSADSFAKEMVFIDLLLFDFFLTIQQKLDVCYSWWILSALSILGRVHWINSKKLQNFILQCQDDVGKSESKLNTI